MAARDPGPAASCGLAPGLLYSRVMKTNTVIELTGQQWDRFVRTACQPFCTACRTERVMAPATVCPACQETAR
jgi:hypothetical protein